MSAGRRSRFADHLSPFSILSQSFLALKLGPTQPCVCSLRRLTCKNAVLHFLFPLLQLGDVAWQPLDLLTLLDGGDVTAWVSALGNSTLWILGVKGGPFSSATSRFRKAHRPMPFEMCEANSEGFTLFIVKHDQTHVLVGRAMNRWRRTKSGS